MGGRDARQTAAGTAALLLKPVRTASTNPLRCQMCVPCAERGREICQAMGYSRGLALAAEAPLRGLPPRFQRFFFRGGCPLPANLSAALGAGGPFVRFPLLGLLLVKLGHRVREPGSLQLASPRRP